MFRQQHAVAEHVAGHIADADAGKVFALAIARHRAEMALDRFPAAARGDAHTLVIVADRAAGRERIVEPETMRTRDAVSDIGERRGAFIGGDNKVRVVAVVAYHVVRRHDAAIAGDVIGDVEQAVDEALVAGHALVEPRIAIDRSVGQLFAVETTFRADRHDHGVLDHLRLHQTQDFGAEVFAAIGPAQTAARDRAETQMHAFDARAANENFAIGPRLRQVRHFRRIEFEAEIVGWAAVGAQTVFVTAFTVVDVIVGAQRRFDHIDEAAQDAVFVQAGDVIQQHFDRLTGRGQLHVALTAARSDHRLYRRQKRHVTPG